LGIAEGQASRIVIAKREDRKCRTGGFLRQEINDGLARKLLAFYGGSQLVQQNDADGLRFG
jgi:hypothetical protein